MNILILHQNFPGQFRNIAQYLAATGHNVLGIGAQQAPGIKDIRLIRYEIKNAPAPSHRFLGTITKGAVYGEVTAKILIELKKQGFTPNIILAHPGWGEALYIKDVCPDVRLVSLFEFYYHARGVDVDFEPGIEPSFEQAAILCSRNMMHLMNLERCDAGISPTHWQKSLHPVTYQHKITVAHEGIPTAHMVPDAQAVFTLPDGRTLRHGDPVVTFVARHLEPYRGFHVFMRALPEIQRRNPQAVTVIVGGDSVSYGRKPEGADSWREKLLAEVGPQLDLSRVIFTGQIPYAAYRSLLQVSAAHVYLTYPFVLSWSALEAMSCGCLMVASATPPVLEVVEHEKNGLLFDFFDQTALTEQVTAALTRPADFSQLHLNARQRVVDHYGIEQGIRQYLELLSGTTPTAS